MTDDVVGLRFISAGLPEILREVKQYQTAVSGIARAESGAANASRSASRTRVRSAQDAGRAAVKAEQDTVTAMGRTIQMQARSAAAAQRRAQQEAAATRQAAAADRALALEKDRLAARFVPLYAASKQYERALQDTARAQQLGVLSARQHEAAVESLNAEFMAFQNGTAGWSNQFVTGATQGARSVNRMGMVMQQTGYQVGDFLVQVQSGTNWMVAFGQQATQIAGLIGLVNPALIGVGAALGILIPLATALGAAWMRTRDAQKDAKDSTDELQKSLESLDQTLKEWVRTKQAAEAGLTVEQLLGTEGLDAANERLATARDRLQEIREEIASGANRFGAGGFMFGSSITDPFREAAEAAANYLSAVERIAQIEQKQAEERYANFRDQDRELRQQLALQAEIARSGADSENVRSLQLEQTISNRQREIALQVASGELTETQGRLLSEQVDQLLRAESANEAVARALRDSESAAGGLNAKLSQATGLAATLLGILGRVPAALAGLAGQVDGVISGLERQNAEIGYQLTQGLSASAASIKALRDEAIATAAASGASIDELARVGVAFDEKAAKAEALSKSLEANRTALQEQTAAVGGSGGAASKAAKEINKLAEEVEKLNFDADPVAKYNAELERLAKLREAGLSDGAFANELSKANEELLKASPIISGFADAFEGFLNGSIKSFKDFAKRIFQDFRNLLAQMITTALRNKVLIPIVMGGGAGGILGSASGGGGLLGSLLGGGGAGGGGIAGIVGGIGQGLGGILSGGGLGASFANLGGLLSGASSGLGAIGAALPAIGIIGGGIALLASAFKKKVTLIDEGLSVAVNNIDVFAETFSTTNTKRFFGLSSKTRTATSAADPALGQAINQMQQGVVEAAALLGFGADAFAGFSYEFRVSLKGLDEAARGQRIAEEITKLGDAFAAMVPHISSVEELLQVVQQRVQLEDRILELQGKSTELLTRRRERELAATNELNRGLLLTIYALEDAAVAAEQAAQSLANITQGVVTAIDKQINASRAMVQEAEQSAQAYRNAADSLRNAAGGIGDRSVAELSMSFARLFARSLSGDLDAMGALGGAGSALAQASSGTARDAVELARIEAGIRNQLNQAAAVADTAATAAEYQAQLLNINTAILEAAREDLNSGNATLDSLRAQEDALGRIGQAIVDSANLQATIYRTETGRVVGGLMDNSGRVVAGLNANTAQQLQAVIAQNGVFTNAITGQTGAITNEQGLTNEQLTGVQSLQDETVNLTDLVRFATEGNAMLSSQLLNRLSAGISINNISALISGTNQIITLIAQLNATTAQTVAAQQEANRQAQIGRLANVGADLINRLAGIAVPEAVRVVAAQYRGSRWSGDKASWAQLSTGETFFNKAGSLQDEVNIAIRMAQDRANQLNQPREQAIAARTQLEAELENYRQQIRALGGTPTFADGGMHTGGLRIVGERGPELEATGPSRIYNASQTAAMLNGGGDSNTELRALRQEVAELRRVMVENVKHTKRTSDTIRTWDGQGLPKERVL